VDSKLLYNFSFLLLSYSHVSPCSASLLFLLVVVFVPYSQTYVKKGNRHD
jgi:hypothetical protein